MNAVTRLMWAIYPEVRLADVFRPGHGSLLIGIDRMLDGSEGLSGFRVTVKDLFSALPEEKFAKKGGDVDGRRWS